MPRTGSSNPVGSMTNPVAPIISSPFLPHPGTTPPANTGRGSNLPGRNHGVPGSIGASYYAPYYAPYYSAPYYDYYYPQVTIPGLPPGARHEDYVDPRIDHGYSHDASFSPIPEAVHEPAPPSVVYPLDLRMIVREPQPNRVIQLPAVGTARPDVIRQSGQPWGSFRSRGIETLYFDDFTVVFGVDGRVTSTRLLE
jgi:hypothetical protein